MKEYLNNLKARWIDDLQVIKGELISPITKIDRLCDDIERRLSDEEEESNKEKSNKGSGI